MEGSVLILTSFDPGILGLRYLYLKFYFIRTSNFEDELKTKKSFYSQLAYVCQDMQLFSHKDTTDFYHLVKSLTISVALIGKIHPTNQIRVRGWTFVVLRPLLVTYQFWSLFGSFNFLESWPQIFINYFQYLFAQILTEWM